MKLRLIGVFLLLSLALLVFFPRHRKTPSDACPGANVLLITIDTLRADHLGVYGYARPTSPNLDRLAANSVVFERAFSQATWTLPSMASLMTSLYPSEHGVGQGGTYSRLDPSIPTLSKLLKAHRYQTAAFVVGSYVDPYFGFDQGFDSYGRRQSEVKAEELTDEALSWLAAHKDRPWFLWLHYFEPHSPYDPPAPYATLFDPDYADRLGLSRVQGFSVEAMKPLSPRDIDHVIALYDGEIRYLDTEIGRLVEYLTSRRLLRNTLVVVTADHGETFHRGMIGHGWKKGVVGPMLFDELIHVPLFIRHPKMRGGRIKTQVQTIDIMPTVLATLGLPIPDWVSGTNMFSLPPATPRPTFSDGYGFLVVRTNDFKLVQNRRGSKLAVLYDLRHDPDERSPVNTAMFPDAAAALQREVHTWEQAVRDKVEQLQIKPLSPVTYPWATVPVVSPDQVIPPALSVDPDLLDRGAWEGHVGWLATQDERTGVAEITHTYTAKQPSSSFLAQRVQLPDARSALVVEARCAPTPESRSATCDCSSTVITITLQEVGANAGEPIYADALDSRAGWKTVALDVSKFAGKDLTALIHAEYGGPCPFSCKQPLLVDRFYIAAYRPTEEEKKKVESLESELRALGYVE